MSKAILLTGATDGIGLETAKALASKGHSLILHGRSEGKLNRVKETINQYHPSCSIKTYCADLSDFNEVENFLNALVADIKELDVLINNAGVFKVDKTKTDPGYDIRFVVNTISPYLITKQLLPLLNERGRVINVSSAAQAPVSFEAFKGQEYLTDNEAYAQSKLAITMWTFELARSLGQKGPSLIAVNPASFLGSKMVKQAYGTEGKDLGIGAKILVRAALDDAFEGHSGEYFDNDQGSWSQPHPDALDATKNKALIAVIDEILDKRKIP